jgi:hypothetical protein
MFIMNFPAQNSMPETRLSMRVTPLDNAFYVQASLMSTADQKIMASPQLTVAPNKTATIKINDADTMIEIEVNVNPVAADVAAVEAIKG